MIVIIDYKAGNLKSVKNALDFLRVESKITNDPKEIEKADKVIFPGVGAFGDTMSTLKKLKLIDPIKKAANTKPFLGICLGLQLLFEESEESPGVNGLGIFKGKVKKFTSNRLKIPQIGWNSINIKKQDQVLSNIKDKSYFYFVHSYYVVPEEENIILTTTGYGKEFVSGIAKDNLVAVQYHLG
jgi:glutamine amidotransferase